MWSVRVCKVRRGGSVGVRRGGAGLRGGGVGVRGGSVGVRGGSVGEGWMCGCEEVGKCKNIVCNLQC